jgi:cytochrome c
VAKLVASRTVGAAPLTVELSADSSFDRDPNDAIHFTWKIPGSADREGARVTQTFTTPGRQHVRLVVRDRAGAESEASTDILVGNAPPQVAIDITGNRSFYWSDSAIDYTVRVTDAEDGTLGKIDPSKVNVSLTYGPAGAAPTAVSTSAGAQSASVPEGLARIRKSDCLACHGIDNASVGPSYVSVAQKYQNHPDARMKLITKIATGGTGVWGDRVMPPHPGLSEDDRRVIVDYILSLASSKLPTRGRAPLTQHASQPGGTYRLTAIYADRPRNGIGPLADTAVVVLHPGRILASSAESKRGVGNGTGQGSDGTTHLLATIYADTAYLGLGKLDLTGVGRVTLEFRPGYRGAHPFTVELRDGSPTGAVLGSADVRASGRDWFTQTVPLAATTGEHALFIVLRSPDHDIEQFNPMITVDGVRFDKR